MNLEDKIWDLIQIDDTENLKILSILLQSLSVDRFQFLRNKNKRVQLIQISLRRGKKKQKRGVICILKKL